VGRAEKEHTLQSAPSVRLNEYACPPTTQKRIKSVEERILRAVLAMIALVVEIAEVNLEPDGLGKKCGDFRKEVEKSSLITARKGETGAREAPCYVGVSSAERVVRGTWCIRLAYGGDVVRLSRMISFCIKAIRTVLSRIRLGV
jgi:hypothetical protein